MFSNNNQQSRRMSSKRLHFVLLTTIVENAGISAFFFLSLSSTCTFIKHCTFPAAAPPFFELESIDCRREKTMTLCCLWCDRPYLDIQPIVADYLLEVMLFQSTHVLLHPSAIWLTTPNAPINTDVHRVGLIILFESKLQKCFVLKYFYWIELTVSLLLGELLQLTTQPLDPNAID
jgi:hypothetical protein